ncbi:peptidylprolyl isomerase [Psychrosphaera ytuae]|uniref:Peptidyl-prolyl cis-trans isomerase n=1 Tax=Psychrosphaera ytuae TaxID=2820710 RepID=A0A975HJE0_9GAMM|nr:peptidylprolyl isomerase [Psychrosphaera ytuae]QTH65128.1 peptidylprolyl isomerase [Psychrosphaera ytuae]
MKIANNSVVTMHYAVKDKEDNLIDSSYDSEPLVLLQGSKFLIEGLENALIGHEKGDTFEVAVDAENAYGPRHDGLVQRIGNEMFADFDVEVGMQLRATTDNGDQTVIVVDKDDESVTVDGNHPLAGVDLKFDVEIIDVREATADEIAHGHAHGAGGCGHSH